MSKYIGQYLEPALFSQIMGCSQIEAKRIINDKLQLLCDDIDALIFNLGIDKYFQSNAQQIFGEDFIVDFAGLSGIELNHDSVIYGDKERVYAEGSMEIENNDDRLELAFEVDGNKYFKIPQFVL